jgi:hypothetical protein
LLGGFIIGGIMGAILVSCARKSNKTVVKKVVND